MPGVMLARSRAGALHEVPLDRRLHVVCWVESAEPAAAAGGGGLSGSPIRAALKTYDPIPLLTITGLCSLSGTVTKAPCCLPQAAEPTTSIAVHALLSGIRRLILADSHWIPP